MPPAAALCLLLLPGMAAGQRDDSVYLRELREVVVTATRSERTLGNVAAPVSVIPEKAIRQAGSLRLRDVLQEQAGLFLTSGFGTGVQVQGLSSDYTLILLNGEPLTGRTAGVLDLNRITAGNIRKIEIVKGPSSSLYGSEALAGVINIITDRSYEPALKAGVRYGSYNTLDLNLSGSGRIGKLGVNAFANSYNTDGFSIRPYTVDRVTLPVWRLTGQVQAGLPVGKRTTLSFSNRYNYEYIRNELAVGNNGQTAYSQGFEKNTDWNTTLSGVHYFTGRLKTSLRLYGSVFEGLQQLGVSTGSNYLDRFRQQFYRVESQTDYQLSPAVSFVGGAGHVREVVQSTRYDNAENQKQNTVSYVFLQNEWTILPSLSLISGVRYDHNELYASAFSPKIAAQWRVSDYFRLNASFGKGFKAPDFRQLYLNFTNTAAGGYSVFGSLEAQKVIAELDRLGFIQSLEGDFYRLKALKPEFSDGWNAGFTALPLASWSVKVNAFRNDIRDLIDVRQVAVRTSGSQIFSYINVSNVYTRGVEVESKYRLARGVEIAAGYQYLETADKDQLKQIRAGSVYTRGSDNISRQMGVGDYMGLPNRSRHMANLKLSYEHAASGFFANLRTLYRSRWAVSDRDGNGLYNTNDEFAKAFVLVNLSTGKSFGRALRVQAGVDNLLDYTDAANLPNMPGRVLYLGLHYSFTKPDQ